MSSVVLGTTGVDKGTRPSLFFAVEECQDRGWRHPHALAWALDVTGNLASEGKSDEAHVVVESGVADMEVEPAEYGDAGCAELVD